MNKKNPLVAGLLNMLAPGAAHLYIANDRGRFIKFFIGGVAALAVAVFGGMAFQRTSGYPLPQGVCIGVLLLVVYVPLFLHGQKTAVRHNMMIDTASTYNARQSGSNDERLAKNQKLLKGGLISKQEYDSRKDNILLKK